ncbi:MAG: 3-phosphoserine/phosphohydroxythreonine transaminase [Spirochaetes bacterium]|nr:MAG: 3-phosphoserine/phosphohydroxythreonine transaminase [Spirochaetota bacterium]
MSRKYNFYAGPATLPLPVLEQIREEIVDFKNMGMSIIETSHRSKEYEEVHNDAASLIKELLGVPDNYQVLFLGGGATLQFSMVPMNLLKGERSCDIVLSGSWAKKAYSDAKKLGKVNVLFNGEDKSFTVLPDPAGVKPGNGSSYVHITSNETIQGVQWKDFPDTGDVPLVADMSSDIMSRPIPVEKFGLIYAGAQKNMAPAGLTVVIIRDDLVERSPDDLTAYLSYKVHAEKNSLYNTPPVFCIYVLKLVMEWVKKQGGISAMEELSKKRASVIYKAIEESDGFYRCPVDPSYRSDMNVVFRLSTEELEKKFIQEAAGKEMIGLKGHRSVGGCRASIYNAMPIEGAERLVEFMKEFSRKNR